jgi:hypothetical protein
MARGRHQDAGRDPTRTQGWPIVTNQIRWLSLLLVRGLLLWLVIACAAVTWIVIAPFMRVGFGQFLGWADLNLIAFLQRSVLSRMFKSRQKWVPLSEAKNVAHRIRLMDPM